MHWRYVENVEVGKTLATILFNLLHQNTRWQPQSHPMMCQYLMLIMP